MKVTKKQIFIAVGIIGLIVSIIIIIKLLNPASTPPKTCDGGRTFYCGKNVCKKCGPNKEITQKTCDDGKDDCTCKDGFETCNNGCCDKGTPCLPKGKENVCCEKSLQCPAINPTECCDPTQTCDGNTCKSLCSYGGSTLDCGTKSCMQITGQTVDEAKEIQNDTINTGKCIANSGGNYDCAICYDKTGASVTGHKTYPSVVGNNQQPSTTIVHSQSDLGICISTGDASFYKTCNSNHSDEKTCNDDTDNKCSWKSMFPTKASGADIAKNYYADLDANIQGDDISKFNRYQTNIWDEAFAKTVGIWDKKKNSSVIDVTLGNKNLTHNQCLAILKADTRTTKGYLANINEDVNVCVGVNDFDKYEEFKCDSIGGNLKCDQTGFIVPSGDSFGWTCTVDGKCVPGNSLNQGTYATESECKLNPCRATTPGTFSIKPTPAGVGSCGAGLDPCCYPCRFELGEYKCNDGYDAYKKAGMNGSDVNCWVGHCGDGNCCSANGSNCCQQADAWNSNVNSDNKCSPSSYGPHKS